SFKQYFSFGVIALTVLFSFLLLQAGLKLNKIKNDLKTGRERLKTIHDLSTLGKLKNGVVMTINHLFSTIRMQVEESSSQLEQFSKDSKEKINELGNLKTNLN